MHFAALSLVSELPGRYSRTKVAKTLNLLEGMLIAGMLVFSSATVYGEPEEQGEAVPR